MKKALAVGINYYKHSNNLFGCVKDAFSMRDMLERNGNESKNFDVMLNVAVDAHSMIERKKLKKQVKNLFRDSSDIALFYFSGHGFVENTGGYLITSECEEGDAGFSVNELLQIANESPAKSKIIILDCCHSGILGNASPNEPNASISEGLTILTASSKDQYAMEKNGSGVFTSLLVDALNGGAANLLGDITPGSIYAHIDQSLGAWEQRPIFKTNVTNFTSLRKVQPSISLHNLKQITALFKNRDTIFPLDPSFEPESEEPDEGNVQKFKILQKYNRANLLIPVGAEHLYYAAMDSKACGLTVLGKHYWNLVKNGRI